MYLAKLIWIISLAMDQWLLCVLNSLFWMDDLLQFSCLLHHWELGINTLSASNPNLLCAVLRLWKPHFCFASSFPTRLCQMRIFTGDHSLKQKEEILYFLFTYCFSLYQISLMYSHWKWQSIPVASVESSLQFLQPSQNRLHWSSSKSSTPAEQWSFLRGWFSSLTWPVLLTETPATADRQLCFEFHISASHSLSSKPLNTIIQTISLS